MSAMILGLAAPLVRRISYEHETPINARHGFYTFARPSSTELLTTVVLGALIELVVKPTGPRDGLIWEVVSFSTMLSWS